MDLTVYDKKEFKGKITSVAEMTLVEYLRSKRNPVPEESLTKFSNLDRDHIVVIAEVNGSAVDSFFMIPAVTGYAKSNLRKFIERNDLPLVNSKNLKSWLGKEVAIKVDKAGYYRIST